MGNPAAGTQRHLFQPPSMTPTWDLGPGPTLWEFFHFSPCYYFVDEPPDCLTDFSLTPRVLSTQCDRRSLLISLLAGLCLQRLTARAIETSMLPCFDVAALAS